MWRSINEEKLVSCKKTTSWSRRRQPTRTLSLSRTHTNTHRDCKMTSRGFGFDVFLNASSTVPAEPAAPAFLCIGFCPMSSVLLCLVFLIMARLATSCATPLTDCAQAGPCWLMQHLYCTCERFFWETFEFYPSLTLINWKVLSIRLNVGKPIMWRMAYYLELGVDK